MSNRWLAIECPKCHHYLNKVRVNKSKYAGNYTSKIIESYHLGYFCFNCIRFIPIGNYEMGSEIELLNVKKKKHHGQDLIIIKEVNKNGN